MSLAAQFLKNRRGGVAPMLALAAIPLIGAVGAAVDYSRANSTRSAMQAALDFDRLDAVAGRSDPVHGARWAPRPPFISTPCFTGPRR